MLLIEYKEDRNKTMLPAENVAILSLLAVIKPQYSQASYGVVVENETGKHVNTYV